MKPAPFSYHTATSVKEAVDLLADLGPDSRVLAGGQSLMPMMNFRLARPSHLIDVNPVTELDYVRRDNGEVVIGARTRQSALEASAVVRERLPFLGEAVRHVAFPTIRHRGTVGGSVAHADPGGELPTALLALDARMVVTGPNGIRTIAAAEFFQGPYETALAPGDLLTEIRAEPWPENAGYAFCEFMRAYHGWAVVGVGALLELDGRQVRRAAVALCGVGGAPVRAPLAEARLVGSVADDAAIAEAAAAAADGTEPWSDVHGSSAYRRKLAGVYVRRALYQARERAGGGTR